MKIVLTDARTMNPGDISWDSFFTLGDVIVHKHTKDDQLYSRVKDADIIVTNKTIIGHEILDSCENLKLICVSATGYNNVDGKYAAKKGIPVCNAANYSSNSVGQHVIAMILNEYNNVANYNASVHDGDWSKSIDFTYYDRPIEEIAGKRFGIIGYGSLGKQVATLALAFGAEVVIMQHPTKQIEVPSNISILSADAFISSCDIISIHVPLTDKTKHMVDADFLKKMKSTALLVNTARGPIVNENDLEKALKSQSLRASLLDVLQEEPPVNSPLFGLQNCTITPHQAWASLQSRQRLMKIVEENIRSFIDGNLQNCVNGQFDRK